MILYIGSVYVISTGRGKWHVWGRGKRLIGFWWGNLRERNRFEVLGLNGRILLR